MEVSIFSFAFILQGFRPLATLKVSNLNLYTLLYTKLLRVYFWFLIEEIVKKILFPEQSSRYLSAEKFF